MASPFPPMPPLPWMPPPLAGSPVTLPVGSVIAFAGVIEQQATPLWAQGYLLCDGGTLLVSEFYELFLAIGYQYSPALDPGKSDPGTFQLPDLQGTFLRGVDPTGPRGKIDPDNHKDRALRNGTTGPNVGSVQQSAFQLHEHDYAPATPSGASEAGDKGTVGPGTSSTSGVVAGPGTSKNETRPINTYVYYIIKYTNAVVPRHLTALLGGTGGVR